MLTSVVWTSLCTLSGCPCCLNVLRTKPKAGDDQSEDRGLEVDDKSIQDLSRSVM